PHKLALESRQLDLPGVDLDEQCLVLLVVVVRLQQYRLAGRRNGRLHGVGGGDSLFGTHNGIFPLINRGSRRSRAWDARLLAPSRRVICFSRKHTCSAKSVINGTGGMSTCTMASFSRGRCLIVAPVNSGASCPDCPL